jgi:hypothetical protein
MPPIASPTPAGTKEAFAGCGLRLGNADSSSITLGDRNGDSCLDACVINWDKPAEVWLNTAS